MIRVENVLNVLAIIVFFLFVSFASAADVDLDCASFSVSKGHSPRGAAFSIHQPETWNKKLIVFSPGYQLEDQPVSLPLLPNDAIIEKFVSRGWVLAQTSYYRTGYVTHDGIADIDWIHTCVQEVLGEPEVAIAASLSTGALLTAMMAEKEHSDFDALLAISPILGMDGFTGRQLLTMEPKRPFLMMAHTNEMRDPEGYRELAVDAEFTPAVWTIDRRGHCRVSAEEYLSAVKTLERWIRGEEIPQKRVLSIPARGVESKTIRQANRLETPIVHVQPGFGNLVTGVTEEDLESVGIKPRDTFNLRVGTRLFQVKYGEIYSDVPRGGWIGLINGNGYLEISRNFENAANTIQRTEGDVVTISPRQLLDPLLEREG